MVNKIILPEDDSGFVGKNILITGNGDENYISLCIPNERLVLEDDWNKVAGHILKPNRRNLGKWLDDIKQMAVALGEINRYYSKKLPDRYLHRLWKRQTELRKIANFVLKRKPSLGLQAKELEKFFGGAE